MSAQARWEAAAIDLLTEFAAGVETCRLYSSEHPRFDRARRRLSARIDELWNLPAPETTGPTDTSELEVAVVQRELFFQGRPFTRVGEQMGVLVRDLSRHRIERIGFLKVQFPSQSLALVLRIADKINRPDNVFFNDDKGQLELTFNNSGIIICGCNSRKSAYAFCIFNHSIGVE